MADLTLTAHEIAAANAARARVEQAQRVVDDLTARRTELTDRIAGIDEKAEEREQFRRMTLAARGAHGEAGDVQAVAGDNAVLVALDDVDAAQSARRDGLSSFVASLDVDLAAASKALTDARQKSERIDAEQAGRLELDRVYLAAIRLAGQWANQAYAAARSGRVDYTQLSGVGNLPLMIARYCHDTPNGIEYLEAMESTPLVPDLVFLAGSTGGPVDKDAEVRAAAEALQQQEAAAEIEAESRAWLAHQEAMAANAPQMGSYVPDGHQLGGAPMLDGTR